MQTVPSLFARARAELLNMHHVHHIISSGDWIIVAAGLVGFVEAVISELDRPVRLVSFDVCDVYDVNNLGCEWACSLQSSRAVYLPCPRPVKSEQSPWFEWPVSPNLVWFHRFHLAMLRAMWWNRDSRVGDTTAVSASLHTVGMCVSVHETQLVLRKALHRIGDRTQA